MRLKIEETGAIVRKAIEAGLNVLLEGTHGTGKTSILTTIASELGLNMKYYSASTLDPFVDLVGLPVPSTDSNGINTLVYHRPQDIQEAEIIFFDELNRAQPKTLNAILETIQFRTINGQPLPKLRSVIAACNPASRDYNVVELDAALVDRFHMYIQISPCPSEAWFVQRFGPAFGQSLYDWWIVDLDDPLQLQVSPRKLEHIGMLLQLGIDPKTVLLNGQKLPLMFLKKRISQTDPLLDIKDFVSDPSRYSSEVVEKPDIACRFAHLLTRMKPAQMARVREITISLPTEILVSLKTECPFVFKKSYQAIEKASGKAEADAFIQIIDERIEGPRDHGAASDKKGRRAA